jgi:hypothetical protein
MPLIKIIHPNGSSRHETMEADPTLADYYKWIGCDMIELISDTTGLLEIVLDEEGKLKRELPEVNPTACHLAGLPCEGPHRIVGTVVVQAAGTMK